MKISVITVVFNAEHTIADTLNSVARQSHNDVEHIVIDGASTDNTATVIKRHINGLAKFVSEPDTGIYDAMNKGCLLYTSPSPRDKRQSRMPSSA